MWVMISLNDPPAHKCLLKCLLFEQRSASGRMQFLKDTFPPGANNTSKGIYMGEKGERSDPHTHPAPGALQVLLLWTLDLLATLSMALLSSLANLKHSKHLVMGSDITRNLILQCVENEQRSNTTVLASFRILHIPNLWSNEWTPRDKS